MSRSDSEAWSNSRDTGEHAFPELNGDGPHVYAYDVRGVKHVPPARLHRPDPFGGDKRKHLQLVPILYEIDKEANEVRFPGRRTLPIPYRQGQRIVLEVSESANDKGAYFATLKCACGFTSHVELCNWRRKHSKTCRACIAKSNKQHYGDGFNPVPVLTVKERVELEAERMRRDPLSAQARTAKGVAK